MSMISNLVPSGNKPKKDQQMNWNQEDTYFPTCLLRKAFSLAVQGDMISSEGEM